MSIPSSNSVSERLGVGQDDTDGVTGQLQPRSNGTRGRYPRGRQAIGHVLWQGKRVGICVLKHRRVMN